MTTAGRIQAAKEKTERVVDHLLYLLALHENNAIIVYSDTLSSRIPYSRAANAFNVFRAGLHQVEIVRLCALWDRAEETKENIPTIAELIDHPSVLNALAEETRSHWANNTVSILNPSNDLQLRKAEEEALKRSDERLRRDRRRCECRSACGSVFDWLGLRALGFDYIAFDGAFCASTWLLMAMGPPPFARKKSPQEKRWKKLARIESLMKPTAQD